MAEREQEEEEEEGKSGKVTLFLLSRPLVDIDRC